MDKMLPMSNNNLPNLLLVPAGALVGVLVALLLLPTAVSASVLLSSVVVLLYQMERDLGLFDLCCVILLNVDVFIDVFIGDDVDDECTLAWQIEFESMLCDLMFKRSRE